MMTTTTTPTQKRSNSDIVTDGSLGVFTVISLILLVWGGLWLRDNYHMHPPRFINVYFHDIAQLSDSANVFIDGVRVGTVDEIHWKGEHSVQVRLKITNHRIKLLQGSRFDILNNGIVGAKYVEIIIPEHKEGAPDMPELVSESTVQGEDPVRPELALNNLVVGLSRIDTEQLGRNFDADRARICRAADQLAVLANKSMPLVDGALPVEHDLHQMELETTKVTHRLNHFMDNPNLSSDTRATMTEARETVASIKDTMHELNLTLKDKDLRTDLITALNSLHKSTEQLDHTLTTVQEITADHSLRDDMKELLTRANESLTKVDRMFRSPTYGKDLRETLSSTRSAIGHIDMAAEQLNQILNKRSPLIHLLIGRPGLVKQVRAAKVEIKKADPDSPHPQTKNEQGNQTVTPPADKDSEKGPVPATP